MNFNSLRIKGFLIDNEEGTKNPFWGFLCGPGVRIFTPQQWFGPLGIAQTTYSQYERGKRPLPIDCLIALCKFYKVSADFILGLSDGNS